MTKRPTLTLKKTLVKRANVLAIQARQQELNMVPVPIISYVKGEHYVLCNGRQLGK